ncbi:MAG: hypothetical protein JW787_10790 [Sedimentisphaerales bacterium]|nr:hypothetical protein [Sedimentisphaerales bacterium]
MIFADYPGHIAAITALAISAILVFLAFRCNELQKEKYRLFRVFLIGLKFLVIVTLIVILWNPSHSELAETFSRNNVLVLFDTSESMSVIENAKKTRLDSALEVFDEKFHSSGKDEPEYKILGFDNDVYHSGSTQLLRRWGKRTNIHNILALLGRYDKVQTIDNASEAGKSDTKGAVIFTDGQADDQHITAYSPLLRNDFPIVIVGMGSKQKGADVEIKTIKAPLKAMIGSIYNVEITAAANNMADDSVIIELLKDNIVIDSINIAAKEFVNEKDQTSKDVPVKFTVAANTLGIQNLSARAKPVSNEVNQANNVQNTFIEVVDEEELKVLFYTQFAEFNAGKLRQVLSSDPRIHLDFGLDAIINVSQSSMVNKELGYVTLPETKEEFNKYDIIILGSCCVDALADEQIDGLYNFVVKRGGGLVLLPGRDEYSPAGWKNPKVKLLIPVIFDANEPMLPSPEPNQVELTTEGNRGIIFSQDDIPMYDFKVSPFYNINKNKPASTTLVSSGDNPIVIIQRTGRGKVCLLNISRLFSFYREDKQGGWLYNLMSGLTSNLGQTPGSSATIEMFAERNNSGENKVRFTAYIRDKDFSPVEQANVLLNFNEQTLKMEPSGSGYYVAEVDDITTDRIVASVQAETSGLFLGEKPIAMSLPFPKNEMSDTRFNEQFLQALAGQINGTYIYADDINKDIVNLFDAQTQVGHTNCITSIWPNWFLWGLLCLLLSFEWFFRRAKGLV